MTSTTMNVMNLPGRQHREKISCRTKVTEILYKILQTATVSFILAGCVTNNHNPEEAFLISPENEAVSSDLCQSPSEVEMSTINNYAEELIHSYNVHYKNEEDALKDAGNTSSLWEYAVFDMGLVNPKHKYITQQINQVKKKQKYFEKQLANGHLYLYHIVNELKSRDMPLELAVIPIIESNFNPYAVSPAGAKGIWQFVPITARNFKLRVDSTYDMRRDVIASTDAALTYFNYLYKIFNDWNLAIAAYNLGEGTVLKAIKISKSKNRPTDLWSLPLPRSGVNYVEKLHAYTDLLRNAKHNNLKFPDMPYRPVFKKTPIAAGTTLKSLSEKTGISIERLKKLNPGFLNENKPTTMVNYALLPINNMDLPENYSLQKVTNPPKESYRKHAIAANIKAEQKAYEQMMAKAEEELSNASSMSCKDQSNALVQTAMNNRIQKDKQPNSDKTPSIPKATTNRISTAKTTKKSNTKVAAEGTRKKQKTELASGKTSKSTARTANKANGKSTTAKASTAKKNTTKVTSAATTKNSASAKVTTAKSSAGKNKASASSKKQGNTTAAAKTQNVTLKGKTNDIAKSNVKSGSKK